jgi:hypothetical protein
MSDDADLTQDNLERQEALSRKYKLANKLEATPTGECLNCFEPVDFGVRWCDIYCQQDWKKRRDK